MSQKRVRNRPVVALVGRANVGKSTLWNRLTETQQALVSNLPNTTRDRNYAPVIWRGASIDVVDTGGMDAEQGSEIGRGILRQAEIAIHEADLVLFMIDVNGGVLQTDHDLARRVKAQNPNIILVANKADNLRQSGLASSKEAWGLGLGEPIACSANTGRGVGDLLDLVYADLTRRGKFPIPLESEEGLRLVVMGRPNVGKSSIVNAILGEERVIVSPVAHTTRYPYTGG
jgi:GTP-binding protein